MRDQEPVSGRAGRDSVGRASLLTISLLWLIGCAAWPSDEMPMVEVPSQNQNARVQFLVLHFTSESFDESMRLLTERTDRPVSSHYLIPEPGDASYPLDRLVVHQLVDEEARAWHAGRSSWRGQGSLNASSIGIELVNRSSCESTNPEAEIQTPEMQSCEFLEYDAGQIELLIELIHGILERHPEIDPIDIVAHSDIAPDRRLDPGPTFPWRRLHERGIGAWYNEETVARLRRQFEEEAPSLERVQRGLARYGYDVEPSGTLDLQTRFALRAFQMHFRPENIDGEIDLETSAILFALLEKYRSR